MTCMRARLGRSNSRQPIAAHTLHTANPPYLDEIITKYLVELGHLIPFERATSEMAAYLFNMQYYTGFCARLRYVMWHEPFAVC